MRSDAARAAVPVARLLGAMVIWSLFAVGGVYVWAGAPLLAVAPVLVVLARPLAGSSRETRALDTLLLATVAAAALHLVPVPAVIREVVAPQTDAVLAAAWVGPLDRQAWRPVSVAPASTAYALGLVMTALVVFWTARRVCAAGMTRRLVRWVSGAGLVAAFIAIALRAGSDPALIYGRWPALDAGARPFGPFVNRNHFATWLVMAIPLAAGYVAAQAAGAGRPASGAAARAAALLAWPGSGSAWVGVAALVMSLALMVSASRSGLVACVASLAVCAWLARRRMTRATLALGTGAAIAIGILAAAYVDMAPLLSRVDETVAVGTGGRPAIWGETARVIRDFWMTGTGLGAYQPVMRVYQPPGLTAFINQAHNQYLQLLAEGGVLVAVLAALTIVAFVRLFLVRLAQDRSASAWLRIGGAAALVAVAVQGVWETGLRMPANGVLFAIAAAVAVYRPAELHRDDHANTRSREDAV